MKDNQIIELYWSRDENAIRETNQKYGNYCFTVADNILHNREDSDECINDTWLQAWKAMPPQKPARLRIFLAKITRNLSFNRFNARTAQKRGGGEINFVLDELAECIASESDVEDEQRKNLVNVFENLSVLYRNEMEMCLFADISLQNLWQKLHIGTT